MRLRYKAISPEGKVIRGSVESNELSDAASYLRQRGLTPITITKEKKSDFTKKLPFSKKVKNKDLVLFTRQVSSMLASGLTLIKALEILKDQTQNSTLRETLGGILLDLQEGTSFSDSISKYPEIFPTVYVSLVRAGESSGLLDQIFLRLANNLEKQDKLRSKVKSALMYPAVVLTLMFVVILLMFIFVIPQLSKLYISLNVDLPFITKIVIFISSIVGKIWPLILGVMAIIYYAFSRWKKSVKGREDWDKFLLRVPLFGRIIKQTILAEFSRTFGLLVGTGTLVVDALNQSAGVTGNVVYEKAISEIAKRVEKGTPVGEAMTYYPIFPSILIQLVKVGEETGKVDENLMKASEYFEEEVDQSVKGLTTAMEPIIMIVLGVGVGFLVFSVISPIYNLLSAIG
ncbi:type II secretion system F family protein [Candidatus Dojkabacteria bacterium]|uniref:Type II secretion system F family protein n=1 Tax=Candidatus Dojkabacteria bacterium TaxID=2099670 RepID=A0A5C7J4S1_9BACT|nr:MAG: type II secretion system F family protein [Candidatus Dojkabacteria bacterium]